MSGKNDPFGSGGKTVIMPMPGGAPRREPISPLPSEPRPAGPPPQSTVIQPAFPVQPPPPPARGYGAPPPGGGYGMPAGSQDAWMRGVGPQMRPPASVMAPLEESKVPVEVPKIPLDVALGAGSNIEYSAANPITQAAAPLLILLGRLRLMIVDMQALPLMNHVAQAITEFEKKVLAAGVAPEDAQVAKYVLCGTADDIVQNLPGTDRHVWMQYSMLAQFFQVRTSGVGFFEELGKVMANPAPRYNLLELMHACLSLGFEGQYRGAAGGDVELQRIRRDVYQTLRHLKARSDDDISPRWRGMALRMRDFSSRVPIWAVASLTAAALVGIFFLLRFMVSNDGEALAATLVNLHPSTNITISRAAFTPFKGELFDPETTQLERIRDGLKDDIASGAMAVEPVGEDIIIRVSNLVLFDSGKAEVKPEFEAVAARIAAVLNKEPGPIKVIGHTDNVKPRPSAQFKSNFDLSVARAQSVDNVLVKGLEDPGRVVVAGKGEDEPVASNATPEGRAQNRRVEIMIQKEETLEQ